MLHIFTQASSPKVTKQLIENNNPDNHVIINNINGYFSKFFIFF